MGCDAAKVLAGLGYRHAWLIDFEFVAHPGHKPKPVCMVAKCLIAGITLRLWECDLVHCPFDVADDVLFVAYFASAEASCFDALGWPRPRRMLDLFTEFRCLTNGAGTDHGNGLIGALLHYRLSAIGGEEKEAMRNLVLAGGPWSEDEKAQILDYCETDVVALERLLAAMLPRIADTPRRFGQALLRGRYMVAAGIVENHGIPVDIGLLDRLHARWGDIKLGLTEAIDADFGVYVGGSFSAARFADYLTLNNIPWPRLPSGALALDDDTFKQQVRAYPRLSPLRELRNTLGQLRLNDLSIGYDGRNRTLLSAFRAKTGRNQPSNSRFIFGPAVWVRHLIKPPEGMAIAYIDWSSQEIAIAGALSGDTALWEAYASGEALGDDTSPTA